MVKGPCARCFTPKKGYTAQNRLLRLYLFHRHGFAKKRESGYIKNAAVLILKFTYRFTQVRAKDRTTVVIVDHGLPVVLLREISSKPDDHRSGLWALTGSARNGKIVLL
jgi:hypothetical protein